jgi:hypothetical protein
MDSSLSIKTSHYVIGAVALTTALSWNGAIREMINKSFPMPKDEIIAGFIYAIIITVILIILIECLPNTVSELPKPVQEKIQNIESETNILSRLSRLERMTVHRQI